MSNYHLAQLNIGRLVHPIDHPAIKPFLDALDEINALADAAPGFIWRLQTEEGNATAVEHPWSADPFMLVNMSVWTTPQALREFVYHSNHRPFLNRRTEWFEKPTAPHYVLWWIPAGHIPSLAEAQERLEHYRQHGPTAHAFWFGELFPAPTELPAQVL